MQMIDAYELIEDIEKARNVMFNSADERMAHDAKIDFALDMVQSARTIDAEPVRRGHWTRMKVSSGKDSWRCSVCGRRSRGKLKNLPYCHCGAKMDGWD